MSMKPPHAAHDAVQTLLDTLVDIGEGYDILIERAEPSITGLLRDVADQHARDISEIRQTTRNSGFEPDSSGTVMSQVHIAVVKFRDFVSDIDRGILESVADGESNVLQTYDAAINTLPQSHDLQGVLISQRQQLRGKISALFEAA